MDQGFGGTPTDAPYHYHSIYDSQTWQETYADPGFFRHTAVAKHLGLVALRLIDSFILPLNTTHYAYELDNYLDRVEAISASTNSDADFSSLRKSIARLSAASLALDEEKEDAEKKFLEMLDKIPGRRAQVHPHIPQHPYTHDEREHAHLHAHGHGHAHCALHNHAHEHGSRFHGFPIPLPDWLKKLLEKILGHGTPPGPIGDFIRAAKRVQAANTKLAAFERGFISEEGIKDREWYRHLGVAPGKWLGTCFSYRNPCVLPHISNCNCNCLLWFDVFCTLLLRQLPFGLDVTESRRRC